MKNIFIVLLPFVLYGSFIRLAPAAEVRIAVAANFTAPAKLLVQAFERSGQHKVVVSVGATGQLYAQIKNGAPLDVLLAADVNTPLRLEQEGAAVPGTRFTYALGKLALWSKNPKHIDPQGQILRTAQFNKIAIADPQLSPYGAATIDVLKNLGVYPHIRPKIVQAANIAQAYQFVATQNAKLGFVALSQITDNSTLREGSVWLVPPNLYRPIQQDAVLLKRGKYNPGAIDWMEFLKTDKAQNIIRSWSYDIAYSGNSLAPP
jgi:molybdate transport system substrate-binding protein